TRAMSATRDVAPRTAKSCGPDTPTLGSSFAEVFLRGDGGKKARSPGRARYKPLKPLRGECRVNRCDRGDYARMLILFCMRGCGCIARPAFPAPSDFEGVRFSQNSGMSCRENAEACLRRTLCVVPANAGTHHHRPSL